MCIFIYIDMIFQLITYLNGMFKYRVSNECCVVQNIDTFNGSLKFNRPIVDH